MTDFRGRLDRLLKAVPGAVGASIMGADGIPIDAVQRDGLEIDSAGLLVEYGALLEQVRQTAQMFAAGDLEELAVRAERVTCVMRPINGEFFLALMIGPRASVGRSRHVLRLEAPQLRPALS